jgi:hypothetical protein
MRQVSTLNRFRFFGQGIFLVLRFSGFYSPQKHNVDAREVVGGKFETRIGNNLSL